MARERDLLSRPLALRLLYGVPILALLATGPLDLVPSATGIVWAASLGVMGGACSWNAWRCGRVHCYFTGPFFLVVGVVALLHGFRSPFLGEQGWLVLGGLLLLGTGTAFISERIRGTYRGRE